MQVLFLRAPQGLCAGFGGSGLGSSGFPRSRTSSGGWLITVIGAL